MADLASKKLFVLINLILSFAINKERFKSAKKLIMAGLKVHFANIQ